MSHSTRYDIAIVGMACLLPDAGDYEQFWANLWQGRSSIRSQRARDADGTPIIEAWAPLDGVDGFDAEYFGYTPREAALLDPQHRKLLECCVSALEDSNLVLSSGVRVGLYAGCGPSTYLHNVIRSKQGGYNFLDSSDALLSFMATDKDFLVSHVAYRLGLRGPCINVQGTCATSLVAVHMACQSLLVGESDVTLAGAAFIQVPQRLTYAVEPGMALSADGGCRPFDSRACGTVFGSGAGVVVLKRLDDALRDGDIVHAVILGSALNNDGATKLGMTAPSFEGQREVIAEALHVAEVGAAQVRYVEGHGTATELGDPLEVAALTAAFSGVAQGACALQSVKANIGHLSYAAGIAGLIKAALAIRDRRLPPAAGFDSPNPHIDFERSPFFVNRAPIQWDDERPIVAGVSAFGLGGVNAHVVLGSAPPPSVSTPCDEAETAQPQLLCISTRSPAALPELVSRYVKMLEQAPAPWPHMARTSLDARVHEACRLAICATDAASAADGLRNWLKSLPFPEPVGAAERRRKLAFVFSGQGNEQAGMARGLYASVPAFRAFIDENDEAFRKLCGHRLVVLLCDPSLDLGGLPLGVLQPLTFCLQVALCRAWAAWGITPDAVVGFSLGEFASACVAGVLTVPEALALCAQRGHLLQETTLPGTMLAIYLPRQAVQDLLATMDLPVDMAGDLADVCTLVAGERNVMAELGVRLRKMRIPAKPLTLQRAGHSRLVDPLMPDLERALAKVSWRPPKLDWVSAAAAPTGAADPTQLAHWLAHTRGPVRFGAAIDALRARGVEDFIEIGPAASLVAAIQSGSERTRSLASLLPGTDAASKFLDAVGKVYEWGYCIMRPADGETLCRLPSGRFNRVRYWADSPQFSLPSPTVRAPVPAQVHANEWRDLPCTDMRGGARPAELTIAVAGDDLPEWIPSLNGPGRAIRMLSDDSGSWLERLRSDEWLGPLVICVPCAPEVLTLEPNAVRKHLDGAVQMHRPLLQALAQRTLPLELWVITCGEPGAAPDALSPMGAWIWGLYRTLRLENPSLALRLAHVGCANLTSASSQLDRLIAHPPATELEFLLCGGGIRVPRMVPQTDDPQPAAFDAEAGAHVILGGGRGVGLRLAVELLEKGAGAVIVTARTGPSAEFARAAEQLTPALALRLHHLQLDVTRAEDWTRLDHRLEALGMGTCGLYLCAAVLRDELCTDLTVEGMLEVAAPKVLGALATLRWLRRRNLEGQVPVVFFSSVSSLAGNPGQASYSAANAFMDALAGTPSASRPMVHSISWGPWSESGWVAQSPALAAHLQRLGMVGMGDRASFDHLWSRLATRGGHRIMASVDWTRLAEHFGLSDWLWWPTDERRIDSFTAPETRGARRPATPSTCRDAVVGVVGAVLGLDVAQLRNADWAERPLLSIGMDSLAAVQIRNRLQRLLSITLPANLCLRHPTLAQLQNEIEQRLLNNGAPAVSRPAASAAVDPTSSRRAISRQQRRWLKLAALGYGRLLLPIRFAHPVVDHILRQAVSSVLERHEVMRWRFSRDGDATAFVMPVDEVVARQDLRTEDLSGLPAAQQYRMLADIAERMRSHVPDPYDGPSWSMRLVRLSPDDFLVLIFAQHLELDGTSVTLLAEDLRHAYEAIAQGQAPWTTPARQYADYVTWQADYLRSAEADADRAFFTGLYLGRPGPTLLPGAASLVPTPCADAVCSSFDLGDAQWQQIRHRAEACDVTPFAVLCAAYCLLVASIAGRNDVTVGTIVAGRSEQEHDDVIGPFVAPFPLALDVSGQNLEDVAKHCHQLIAAINARASFPPSEMVRCAGPFIDLPEETYFTDSFIMFNNYRQVQGDANLEVLECLAPVKGEVLSALSTPFLPEIAGLFLIIDEHRDGSRLNVWHHEHRFDRRTVAGWFERYVALLMGNAPAANAMPKHQTSHSIHLAIGETS